MKKNLLVIFISLLLICANVFVPTASAWNVSGELFGNVNNTICTGDFLISPDGINWGDEFRGIDLMIIPTNSLPANLTPVSFNPVNRRFSSVYIDELGACSSTSAALASYVKYTFYAKLPYITEESTEVQLTADLKSGVSFAYAAVDVDSDIYLLNKAVNRSYFPVISSSGFIGIDANSNNIIEPSENGGSDLGPRVNASTSPMTIPLTFTRSGEIKTITVYMWSEGQDQTCSGHIPASTADLSISINAPSAAFNLGDINQDGKVSSVDALLALQASSGLLIFNEEQRISADVNVSKSITSLDALMILQYSAGLITTF